MNKFCSNCKKDKSLDDFGNDKSTKSGKSHYCKSCRVKISTRGPKSEKRRLSGIKAQVKWDKKNKDKHKVYDKKRRLNRKSTNYINNRLKTDSNFKITYTLRSRLLNALKYNLKSNTTLNLLGCSIEELKVHLESQFTEGMNWDNYGKNGWHVDHIVPIAYFNLSDSFQQQLCFHFTNLQPLWWYDNYKKGNKLTPEIMELLELK